MGQGVEGFELVRVGYDHPDAVRLIDRVQGEYVERYGSPDDTPVDPLVFDPPHGSFFLGYLDGTAVATGAWRRADIPAFGHAESAELKRMYVVPEARGRGVARVMLRRLEESAYAAGLGVAVLETGLKQPEAIAFYESSGYTRIPGFGHYRDSPLSRCFGRRLGPSA